MATNAQIIDLLRSFRKKLDSRLADNANAGLMSADDKIKLDNIQVDYERGTLSILTRKGILTFTCDKTFPVEDIWDSDSTQSYDPDWDSELDNIFKE